MELAVHLRSPERPTSTGTAAPPVLLLHGFTSSAETDFGATGLIDALVRSGRTAIAVDLPGHGESPGLGGDAEGRADAVVGAILAAADKAADRAVDGALSEDGRAPGRDRRFDVIGYSLGSRLAWELPLACTRVRRMVLGGLSPFEPFAGLDFVALERALAGAAPADPMLGMIAGMIGAPGQRPESLLHLMRGLASTPFSPAAGVPAVPTLLVAGDADPMTQGIEEVAAGLADGGLVRVPGDHPGALASAEFRDAALRFLA